MVTKVVASSVRSRIAQLAFEMGLRILRASEFVLDCRSEDGLHNYEFSYMPFGHEHVDIELSNLLEEEDDQPHWAHIVAACMQANKQCKNVLVVPVGGHQVAVRTEIPLTQFNSRNVAYIQDRMAELHDGAAVFFSRLADIEMGTNESTIPAFMIEHPEHLQ